jgi:hypothetical protein
LKGLDDDDGTTGVEGTELDDDATRGPVGMAGASAACAAAAGEPTT